MFESLYTITEYLKGDTGPTAGIQLPWPPPFHHHVVSVHFLPRLPQQTGHYTLMSRCSDVNGICILYSAVTVLKGNVFLHVLSLHNKSAGNT